MKYFKLWLFLFLLFSFQQSRSQEIKQTLIHGNFNTFTLGQFALQIESQVHCHFYIDPALADSFRIKLDIQGQPLAALLDMAFKNSAVQYALDPDGHVFLTKDRKVEIALPADFFDQEDTLDKITHNEVTVSDYAAFKKTETLLASLENLEVEIGSKSIATRSGKATISGYVHDSKTGEALPGVSVYSEPPIIGVVTDAFGYYAITLPTGKHVLNIRNVGMKDTKRPVLLYSDGKLNIDIEQKVITLKDVVITSDKGVNVRQVQMGIVKLNAQTLRQVPTLFGE
jgi:hypothetical protein